MLSTGSKREPVFLFCWNSDILDVASHYTLLANAYGAKPAKSQACHQVSTIAHLTECSLAIDLPSA